MDAENEGVRTGAIPLGATRPPMVPIIGLPFSAAVPLLLIATEVQIGVSGIKGMAYAALIVAAIALPLRAWVSFDWYAIDVLLAWARTSGRALDATRWGGSSLSHFPIHPAHRAAEPRGMLH